MKLLHGWPAVVVEKPVKTLIVSDVHFGFEAELAEKGIRVPSQTRRLKDRLVEAVKMVDARRMIFLGDLKHMVPLSSRIEWREMPRALEELRDLGVELVLIPGNHDGDIERILGDLLRYEDSRGVLLEAEKKLYLLHGHTRPSPQVLESEIIIMGHLHPVVSLRTDLGLIVRRRIWLYARGDKRVLAEKLGLGAGRRGRIDLLVMPAFNPILTGMSVNSSPPREKLWPLIRSGAFNLDQAEAITLQGERLGSIRYLRSILGGCEA